MGSEGVYPDALVRFTPEFHPSCAITCNNSDTSVNSYQLTGGTRTGLYVKAVAVYTAIGFLTTEASLFIFCRPFHQYWAMPTNDPQCHTYQHYCIVQTCTNISSDLFILAIPIPMIACIKVDPWKRVLLVAIFGLGMFTVLASILNKYYTFTSLNTTTYSEFATLLHVRLHLPPCGCFHELTPVD